MDVEAAASCVAYLTSMTSGWNDDATEQLVYEFERLDNAVALADAVQKVARTWTSSGRVPLGVIVDAYEHERRLAEGEARRQMAERAIRCDGSGWVTRSDESGVFEWPCTTCNPATVRVWNDPESKRKWRHGHSLHSILGYDSRADLLAELRREPCETFYDADWIDQRDGMALAVETYRATYGKEPPKAMRAMIAAAAKRTPREDF